MADFRTCYQRVGEHEGGWVNHKHDDGGATMKGVTQATYNRWRRKHGLPIQSVRLITPSEHEAIYREFWDAVRCDWLPPPVAYVAFDSAILFGPDDPAEWMQAVSGAKVDGRVGPETIGKVHAMSPALVIKGMLHLRRQKHQRDDDFPHFGKGWMRRCDEVEKAALDDLAKMPPPSPLTPVEAVRTPPERPAQPVPLDRWDDEIQRITEYHQDRIRPRPANVPREPLVTHKEGWFERLWRRFGW